MMTPLHLSSADLVNLPIHRSRHRKRPVVPQSSIHSRDGVPSVCSLGRVGEVDISRGKCRHYLCLSCKVCLCKIPCFTDYHKN